MISAWRTLSNIIKVGPKEYLRQLNRMGDTKVGTLMGVDKFGNKYFENTEDEIIMRTRWVQFEDYHHHMDQVEPGWRAWLVYTVDTPPSQLDPKFQAHKAVPSLTPAQIMAHTGTTGNYVPYSTVRPKLESCTWQPVAKERV